MSDKRKPEIGDRVKVEFEGRVVAFGNDTVTVNRQEVRANSFVNCVKPSDCTVIVPPVKVGDTVTANNIEQLPACSLIARPGLMSWYKSAEGAWQQGNATAGDSSVLISGNRPLIVLRVGGGS